MAATGTAVIVEGLRLIRRVGAGGEGEVWEARDAAGRPRACKLIRPDALAESSQVAERAAYLRRIDHPALVRVHRSGVLQDGRLAGWGFVEMDFVEGTPLDEAPPDPEAIERLEPLAEALDRLHAGEWSNGLALVHRDVKPGNLLETPGGAIVLVDPSTLRGIDTGPHTRIGTPLFCAPEVLRGKVTPAADRYSFAATLVALASGARGEDLAALLDDPDQLDLPAGVRRALSPRPSDRPRSCRAVLSAAEDLTRAFPGTDGWLAGDDHTAVLAGEADGPDHLDGLHDPDGTDEADEIAVADGPVLPWVLALAALVVTPVAAHNGNRPDALPAVLALAGVLHLFLQLFARRPLAGAVFTPPLAWADLLAARAAGPARRRAWASVLLLGGIAIALAPTAVALSGAGASPTAVTASTGGAAVLLVGLALLPRLAGPEAAVLRLLALPVWLLGFAVLVAGAVLAVPLALAAGRTGALLRRVGRSLGGVVEAFLPPR